MKITLEDGVAIAQWLEEVLAPKELHVALGGSVLYNGSSNKDLDIIVYPHQASMSKESVSALLQEQFPELENPWGVNMPYPPGREIRRVTLHGVRIEFFLLN